MANSTTVTEEVEVELASTHCVSPRLEGWEVKAKAVPLLADNRAWAASGVKCESMEQGGVITVKVMPGRDPRRALGMDNFSSMRRTRATVMGPSRATCMDTPLVEPVEVSSIVVVDKDLVGITKAIIKCCPNL